MSVVSIIMAGVSLAIGIAGLVLSKKAQDAVSVVSDADKQTLGDMQQTEQREGIVVPVVYGHGIVTGSLIWWDAQKMNTGGNSMYYRYKCIQTLCMGEIYISKYHHSYSYQPLHPDWTSPQYSFSSPTMFADDRICDIDRDYFLNLSEKLFGFMEGWYQQPSMLFLNNGEFDYAPYDNWLRDRIAVVFMKSFATNLPKEYYSRLKGVTSVLIGMSWENDTSSFGGKYPFIKYPELGAGVTQIPTFKFMVRRAKLNVYDYNCPDILDWPSLGFGRGSNPAAVYYDLLVNNQYGGDIDATNIDTTSFQAASDYFKSKNIGLNFVINGLVSIREIVLKIQEWTDSYLIKDINDKYAIKILKDTDSPVCTIDIDEEQVEFVLNRKSWDDTYNCFTANYKPLRQLFDGDYIKKNFVNFQSWQIYKNEDVETLTIKNEANIELTGSERQKVVDLTCYTKKEIASERLTQIMKKESYPFANATLTTGMKYYYLRVGDVVTVDSDKLNVAAPFRIINVNYQKIDENKLTFDLLQMRELLTDEYYHNGALTRGENTKAEYPLYIENVTFPAFTAVSNTLARKFIDDSKSVVLWGTGQLRSGRLKYGTDYTVIDHNKIKLDENIFEDEIGFNGNGLLNIDVFEDIEEVES